MTGKHCTRVTDRGKSELAQQQHREPLFLRGDARMCSARTARTAAAPRADRRRRAACRRPRAGCPGRSRQAWPPPRRQRTRTGRCTCRSIAAAC